MSWYLKYRPRQVADLDLAQVRDQLLQLMNSGSFPHSFLFAGPKGTGKTSASRIIGAILNDPINQKAVEQIYHLSAKKPKKTNKLVLHEPDPDSEFARRVFSGHSLVVQEMDAASNRGIDDIRQLKERAYISPQEGSISVYILDEVHMLTNEAFNALLKILEEPPVHVVFILATTELHKVPATIVSRCNLISFYKAGSAEITDRLKKILQAENIKFEQDALLELARRSDGSFRDAVKLAEITSQSGEITLEKVDELIGGSALVEVKKLLELILIKDKVKIAQFFESLRQHNMDEDYFVRSLLDYLHQNMLGSLGVIEFVPQFELKVSQYLLNQLVTLDLQQISPIAFLPLELLLLRIAQKAKGGSQDGGGDSVSSYQAKTSSFETKSNSTTAKKLAESEHIKQACSVEARAVVEINNIKADDLLIANSLSSCLCERWNDFLQMVEDKNSTLAALLRSSQPQAGLNGLAEIKVFYKFHQEQLEQPKLRQIVEECGQKIVGDKIGFKFILTSPPARADVVDVSTQTENLEALAKEVLM